MRRWMEPLKRRLSEWQQNKEIIGERETRLPHQWPLYALSQLSEGEDVWTQSSPAQSSPSTVSISTIRIHLDIKSVEKRRRIKTNSKCFGIYLSENETFSQPQR